MTTLHHPAHHFTLPSIESGTMQLFSQHGPVNLPPTHLRLLQRPITHHFPLSRPFSTPPTPIAILEHRWCLGRKLVAAGLEGRCCESGQRTAIFRVLPEEERFVQRSKSEIGEMLTMEGGRLRMRDHFLWDNILLNGMPPASRHNSHGSTLFSEVIC